MLPTNQLPNTPPVVPPPVLLGGAGAPPPPAPPAPPAPAGGINNVGQIDTGGQAFTQITGNNGGGGTPTEPIAQVPPVTPAPQAIAKPPSSDVAVGGRGSNLFQTKPVFLLPPGVPGIDNQAPASGNRSLWGGTVA
jgi:hypothetical protein